jgi:iron(III) transport system substrate-binding protein
MKKALLQTALLLAGLVLFAQPSQAQQQLPAKFANDPVAKALGPEVFNAALKEGSLHIYGSETVQDFMNARKKAFEDRFGIKIEPTIGTQRKVVDRLRTEISVGKPVCDVIAVTDQYMLEVYPLNMLEKWRPPGRELDNISKEVFPTDPEGFWWPAGVSAQGLAINTDMVKKEDFPKSYWDIADPKWKGKVAIRDPRSAAGGAWMFLHFYTRPDLGIDYIKKLKATADPFILSGQVDQLRDAVLLGRFAIGFNGRGELARDLPKGSPVAFHVPQEGLAWTPQSIALVKDAKRSNAGKVFLTWFYDEIDNLQAWSNTSRPIPHPQITPEVPEMSLTAYPLMPGIPGKLLGEPDFFFKEMEQIFGKR